MKALSPGAVSARSVGLLLCLALSVFAGPALPASAAEGSVPPTPHGETTDLGNDMVDPVTLLPVAEEGDADAVVPAAPPVGARQLAAPQTTRHTLDVAVVVPFDSTAPLPIRADPQIRELVAGVSEYWSGQTGGRVASIEIDTQIQRYTSPISCSQYVKLWEEAAAKFGDTRGGNSYTGSTGRHLLVLTPARCGGPGFATVADGSGVPGSHFGGLIFANDNPDVGDLLAHEFGHNLGLLHSNGHQCAAQSPAATAQEGWPGPAAGTFSDGCTDLEYGDNIDVMGKTWVHYVELNAAPAALSAPQAIRLGVMEEGAIQRIALTGAAPAQPVTLELASAGGTAGIRTAVITDPLSGEVYYLENRDGQGQDAKTLYGQGKIGYAGALPGVRMLALRPRGNAAVFTQPDASIVYRFRQTFQAGDVLRSRSGGVMVRVLSIAPATRVATVSVQLRTTPPAGTPVGSSVPKISGSPMVGEVLTAVAGIWSTESLGYAWAANGVAIPGATGPTLVLGEKQDGAAITVTVTGTKPGYLAAVKSSAPSARVISAPVPRITGAVEIGGILTVDDSGWPAGTTLTRQWLVDGSPVDGATAAQFELGYAHIDKRITVRVTGARAGSATVTRLSEATNAVGSNTVKLIDFGSSVEGTAGLRVPSTGIFTGAPAATLFLYQWLADGAEIPYATGPAYHPAVAGPDAGWPAGTNFSVRVAIFVPARMEQPGNDPNAPRALEIRETAVIGTVLQAGFSGPLGQVSTAYQWRADGKKLAGATKPRLSVTVAMAGKRIAVTVSARDFRGTTTLTSAATPRVSKAGVPAITGVAVSGSTLTAAAGSWTTGTVLRYQWLASGTPVEGAIVAKFAPPKGLSGQTLTVQVTGEKPGYATVVRESAPTKPVLAALTVGTVKITGAAKVNGALTATLGNWGPGELGVGYQWKANGIAIAGAKEASFTPRTKHLGKRITVTVSATRPGFATGTGTSAATAKIVR